MKYLIDIFIITGALTWLFLIAAFIAIVSGCIFKYEPYANDDEEPRYYEVQDANIQRRSL